MSRPTLAALVLLALVAGPARAQVSDLYGRAWVRVSEPVGEIEVDLPLVEVEGYAGARSRRGQDLVIVIDVSDSTIEASGVDLDGDGATGRTDTAILDWLASEPDVRESLIERVDRFDFDDSVLMAELAAAYELVTHVDPRLFRIGIVAFSGHAWVVTPVGSSREDLIDALDHLRWNFFYDLGGTDFVDAIRVAIAALEPPPGEEEAEAPTPAAGETELRDRSILFLSDGAPTGRATTEGAWREEEHALAMAREAADRDIRLFAYALGPQAIQAMDVYRGMAELSGGRFEKIERPGDAVVALRSVDLMDVAELRIENLRTGASARALRSFPDGSFDGLVELEPGENTLRFTARALSGSTDTAVRKVVYREPTGLTEEQANARQLELDAMVAELRDRTRETEFIAEMARRKPPQDRELELRAAPGDGAPSEAASDRAPVASGPPATPED